MNISILYRFRPLLVILGWATCLASLSLGVIFQGLLLPNASELSPESFGSSSLWLWIFYLGSFGVSVLAALVISDFGQAAVSMLFAYLLTALIIFVVLALPDFVGIVQPSGILAEPSVTFAFNALFPYSLLVDLTGTVAGSAVSERMF